MGVRSQRFHHDERGAREESQPSSVHASPAIIAAGRPNTGGISTLLVLFRRKLRVAFMVFTENDVVCAFQSKGYARLTRTAVASDK